MNKFERIVFWGCVGLLIVIGSGLVKERIASQALEWKAAQIEGECRDLREDLKEMESRFVEVLAAKHKAASKSQRSKRGKGGG